MTEETHRIDWQKLSDDLSKRTHDLWTASLGVVAAVEEQGERIYRAVRKDRGSLVEEMQDRSTKALDGLQTEANRVFDGLVARGEKLQTDSMHFVEGAARDLAAKPKAVAHDLELALEKAVAAVLHRLDVPSRKELERLSDRVERLTSEVTRLAARLAGEVPAETPALIEVASDGTVWTVRDMGTGQILDTADTKGEAVRLGRDRAHAMAPSQLRILKLDGSVQDTNHYEAMA